jgi:hypothetical protein
MYGAMFALPYMMNRANFSPETMQGAGNYLRRWFPNVPQ